MKYYIYSLRNYSRFSGRARRKEYWNFFFINVIAGIILAVIDVKMSFDILLSSLYSFLMLIPGLAVAVRRMHDVGKSGWYILIPVYNLILALTPGNSGLNEYGPDPKNPVEFDFDETLN